jgi:PncC family amidohydrolase
MASSSRSSAGTPRARVIHLFGPGLNEVADLAARLSSGGRRPIVWDEFPEVRVKCWEDAVAAGILDAYGAAAYSVAGASFEATVGAALAAAGLTLATAESCTGGLVGERVTSVPGSSACFRGGVVAYSNEAKRDLLGVPPDLVERHGAVSGEVVAAMAQGARRALRADVAVAVSGVAGPGGGTPGKPVGTVWIAVAAPGVEHAARHAFEGDRERVRRAAAWHALDLARRVAIGAPLEAR